MAKMGKDLLPSRCAANILSQSPQNQQIRRCQISPICPPSTTLCSDNIGSTVLGRKHFLWFFSWQPFLTLKLKRWTEVFFLINQIQPGQGCWGLLVVFPIKRCSLPRPTCISIHPHSIIALSATSVFRRAIFRKHLSSFCNDWEYTYI